MTVTTPDTLEIRTSPHIKADVTTDVIMRNVVYALMPICAFAVWSFGLSALTLICATTATCVLTEHLVCKFSGKPTTVTDFSAVITGILLALTLPPGIPLWMGVVGAVIAILLGKALFGGLGFNTFNPALVARAFLQAAFPVAMTKWIPSFVGERFTRFIPTSLTLPFLSPDTKADALANYLAQANVDGWSGATPLSLIKFEGRGTDIMDLFTGMVPGSTGETCAVFILLGGAYLVARGMMNWRITAAMLGAAYITSWLFYLADNSNPTPAFMLVSGGLMLGAVFMATDMVASPTTPLGVWIYGGLMGFLTILIRIKGGLPEGVMYAILLGNAVSPHIENLTQPRVFGAKKRQKAAE
ncbi:MAG: RnfABCDGE type electron transport complex subunit D [Candidatus Hydrogenedentota bacterium]